MRRTTLLLVTMGCLLMIFAGVALAVNRTGTNQADILTGDPKGPSADKFAGGGGQDKIKGVGLNDELYGDFGADPVLDGGGGDDLIDGGSGAESMNGGGDDYLNAGDNAGGDLVDGGSNQSTTPGDKCIVDDGDSITSATAGQPPVTVVAPTVPVGTTCETITVVRQ